MAPTITGPWRGWHESKRKRLENHNTFEGCDSVWWTQSDPGDAPGEPGSNINEFNCSWTYEPKSSGDPAELVVQYITHKKNNKRYGQFIFPGFFLEEGSYVISCRIVNKNAPPDEYVDSWEVTVKKPAESQS
jgi:hypothetical protein